MDFFPVILSGGSGSRLWPLSRELYPKPLLPIVGDKTLLQMTVERLAPLADRRETLVVCNEEHRYLVADQLKAEALPPGSILLEPCARDTAPALTLAALQVQQRCPGATLIVMPADHLIPDSTAFCAAVTKAGALARDGYLVSFGLRPDRPETGYGYIHRGAAIGEGGAFSVDRFVEKPDASTAQSYLDAGDYDWNAGIFVVRADLWLEEISRHRPLILAACKSAIADRRADGIFLRAAADAFANSPAESIDYAVMENTDRAAVLPLDTSWSDIGSWASLWEVSDKDSDGNVCKGDVISHSTHNSLLLAQNRCIATVGLENITVIETSDAVLVASTDKCQDVKTIVTTLKQCQRNEHRFHSRVHRPWGNYEGIDKGKRYQVKRITVKPGAKLSLQMHHHRAEHWVVVSGTAKVTVGDTERILTENESTYVPLGSIHRLENPGTIPLEIIEVQSGSYLGEDDIVRLEDIYDRAAGVAV